MVDRVFCPACKSNRIKRYGRDEEDYYCKKCNKVFVIVEKLPAVCFHCNRIIEDHTRAEKWGNDKSKHIRCRRRGGDI
jgi:uncharacterized protein YbaR (Trm112 family)